VSAPLQLVLDRLELCPLSLRDGDALEEEASVAGLGAGMREAQEVERLRLAQPALGPSLNCEAAELDQASLVLVQFQTEPAKPPMKIDEKLLSVT